MPWAKDQKLRFRWDIFNITNTPRMDVGNVTMFPDRANTFGTYNGSLASLRRRRRPLHAVRDCTSSETFYRCM